MDLKIKYILNSKFQKILLYKNKYQNRNICINILFGRIPFFQKIWKYGKFKLEHYLWHIYDFYIILLLYLIKTELNVLVLNLILKYEGYSINNIYLIYFYKNGIP